MKNLHFEFTVNKENNTISVTREFAANLNLVWDAWTQSELLDQWWAPKPFKVVTKAQNFTEGGHWLYAMISPDNEAHWCRADYKKIEPHNNYSLLDGFCDENGNLNTDFPRSFWTNKFTQTNATTTVNITIAYDSLADLEKFVALGFKEGFTMCIGNLDELLLTLTQ